MNDKNSTLNCPACKKKSQYLVDWEYSGLDESIFNYIAKLYECLNCGLVYIKNITDERLSIFYARECSYFEKSHFNISSPENIEKYKYYRNTLVDIGLSDTKITDIGCGRGGFLKWLINNNWNADCVGVDVDIKSIPDAIENKLNGNVNISFKEGKAVALPFASGTQSLLTYFHVLEHICNIDQVLQEAFRVLNETGHILIEVPDAERYKDYPIGTAFWLSIREHIYHFSARSLSHALFRNGFEVININRKILPTPEFIYPSLMILARKNNKKNKQHLCAIGDTSSFIIQSKEELEAQAKGLLELNKKYFNLTFWGISSELFSLLPLLNFNFILCDSSKFKQQSHYKGIPIKSPEIVSKNGLLIIAPYLYSDAIEKAAIEYGWEKEAILKLK